MPVSPGLGACGQGAHDHYLRAYMVPIGRALVICCGRYTWLLRADRPLVPGAKVTVTRLPKELLRHATHRRVGGGAFNSVSAMQDIAPDLTFHYLDAGREDRELLDALPRARAAFLGLRPLPRNALIGEGADRTILRCPHRRAPRLGSASCAQLDRFLTSCRAVLLNSVKDEAVARYIAATVPTGCSLSVVATPSLDPAVLTGVLLPAVRGAVIAACDEVAPLVGFPVHSFDDARRAVARLRAYTPGAAAVLLTLGQGGVLASSPGDAAIYHVCLEASIAAEVQALVHANPARRTGAGDAFAGGEFLAREAGRRLLAAECLGLPPLVRAACAGTASALRWMGCRRRLRPEDFDVSRLADPCALPRCREPA